MLLLESAPQTELKQQLRVCRGEERGEKAAFESSFSALEQNFLDSPTFSGSQLLFGTCF